MAKVKYFLFVLSSLLIFAACNTPSVQKPFGKNFMPPKGKQFYFTHQYNYPHYQDQNLPKPFGVSFYTNLSQGVSIEFTRDEKINELGTLLQKLDTTVPLALIWFTGDQLLNLSSGKYDLEIDAFAQTIIKYEKPIYISPGFEVNNAMFEWNGTHIKKTYKYFVEKMKKNGVKNASYVWHIVGMKPRYAEPITFEQCYPGDDYVNWVGLSVHNLTEKHYPEDSFYEKSIFDEVFDFASTRNLPVMVCESSTRSVNKIFNYTADSLWNDWYEPFFKLLKNKNVHAFSHTFYDYDDNFVLEKWKTKLADKKYVLQSTDPETLLKESN